MSTNRTTATKKPRPRFALLAAALLASTLIAPSLLAHCQIPCGIYGDKGRFDIMREHVQTIEKSMNEIVAGSKASGANWNQMVRWVQNKDSHADELTEIVTYYFLAQRIKPVQDGDEAAQAKYQKELTLLHHMIVFSMKAKQTTDLSNVKKLNELIDEFQESYMGGGDHKH
ncbi:MAG: superoxide dismutase [Ni] [Acidobacteriota bacterium]